MNDITYLILFYFREELECHHAKKSSKSMRSLVHNWPVKVYNSPGVNCIFNARSNNSKSSAAIDPLDFKIMYSILKIIVI